MSIHLNLIKSDNKIKIINKFHRIISLVLCIASPYLLIKLAYIPYNIILIIIYIIFIIYIDYICRCEHIIDNNSDTLYYTTYNPMTFFCGIKIKQLKNNINKVYYTKTKFVIELDGNLDIKIPINSAIYLDSPLMIQEICMKLDIKYVKP